MDNMARLTIYYHWNRFLEQLLWNWMSNTPHLLLLASDSSKPERNSLVSAFSVFIDKVLQTLLIADATAIDKKERPLKRIPLLLPTSKPYRTKWRKISRRLTNSKNESCWWESRRKLPSRFGFFSSCSSSCDCSQVSKHEKRQDSKIRLLQQSHFYFKISYGDRKAGTQTVPEVERKTIPGPGTHIVYSEEGKN